MNQELEEGRYYKNANQITQIIVAFVIFMCFFAMTPVGFTLYSKYALPVGLALLIIVFLISGNVVHMNKGDFFYIIFLISYYLFTLPLTGGGIGSIFPPVMTVLWIQIMGRCRLTNLLIRYITKIFSLLFSVILIRCPDYFLKWTVRGETGMNPNTLAVLIVLSSSFILIFNQSNRVYKKYHLLIPQILLTCWGILNCKSRASLLMFITFLTFKYLIPKRMRKKRKVACFICYSCIAIGLLFPMFYVYLNQFSDSIKIPFINTLFSEKSLFSGRERIWNNIFMELSKKNYSWIIGIGSKADIRTVGAEINPHNAYMMVLMDFGFLGVVAYYSFYIFYIKKIYGRGKLFIEQIDLIYLGLSFFILSFFETVLLWHPFVIITGFIWGISQGYNINGYEKLSVKDISYYEGR